MVEGGGETERIEKKAKMGQNIRECVQDPAEGERRRG